MNSREKVTRYGWIVVVIVPLIIFWVAQGLDEHTLEVVAKVGVLVSGMMLVGVALVVQRRKRRSSK